MAAYAALVSLMHSIDHIENHPSPPIILHKKQVQSLAKKVNFLQEFLETYQSPVVDDDEADPLEMRIQDSAYEAEDVIESYLVDTIKLGISTTTSHQIFDSGEGTSASAALVTQRKSKISFDYFGCLMKPINHGQKFNPYQGLQKVMKEMSAIKKEVMKIKKGKTGVDAQLQRNMSTSAAASSRSSAMVGLDDVLLEILKKLFTEERNRQVIPIVGMGGIGKTTLARHVYEYPSIKDHFDVCVWVTISQSYNTKEILCDFLCEKVGFGDFEEILVSDFRKINTKRRRESRDMSVDDCMLNSITKSLVTFQIVNYFFM